MVDKAVNKTIFIQAPLSKVWDALTVPMRMVQWMSEPEMDMNISTDWKIGNGILMCGDLHGIRYENKGTVLQFDPSKILAYTLWSSLSEQADKPENYAVIEFRLFSHEDHQTRLTLDQHHFITEATFKHWEFYWNVALELLKKQVEATIAV